MVNDFSRKGIIDGLSLRLPTICVRPGKANAAASSFFSGIIREPLNGFEAILPVADTVRHWHASPRAAAQFLIHAALLDTKILNGRRALNLPGFSCTVAEQIEALRHAAGQKAVDLIKSVPDETIINMVSGWPRDFQPDRAISLGFEAEKSFNEIIEVYMQDDLST
jgi:nucleoside-diphosphate-sugar epimerase